MQTKHGFVSCIAKGSGSLKYYKYHTSGIKLRTKRAIVEAMNLDLEIFCVEKANGNTEKFNYDNLRFEEV